MSYKLCPNCKKTRSESTIYCDCGYNFETEEVNQSFWVWPDKQPSPLGLANVMAFLGGLFAALFFIPGWCIGSLLAVSEFDYSLYEWFGSLHLIYYVFAYIFTIFLGAVIGIIIGWATYRSEKKGLWQVVAIVLGVLTGSGAGAGLVFILLEIQKRR